MFPIGNLTKEEVMKIATELGLPSINRLDSQEICFIPDNDHAAFVEKYTVESDRPGPIRDETGRTLGQHRGIASYTVGQRKGLGIAAAEPLYVTAIESERNTVIVGTKEQTYGTELIADNLNWIAITAPEHPIKVKAKLRYRHTAAEATVIPQDDGTVRVKFAEPQMAITPVQAIVFYDGEKVTGGGTIINRGK
jgi:tRNA-specific 2-thiouridylase